MTSTDSPFSVHIGAQGQIALYLEEQDANLDMLEDILEQVTVTNLSCLKGAAWSTSKQDNKASDHLTRVRQGLPPVVAKVIEMTEAEALTLASLLVNTVIAGRTPSMNRRIPSLHPVKMDLVK